MYAFCPSFIIIQDSVKFPPDMKIAGVIYLFNKLSYMYAEFPWLISKELVSSLHQLTLNAA